MGDPLTPADHHAHADAHDDASPQPPAARPRRRRLPTGRTASPWSRRLVFGAVLVVVMLAPLWLDPLTLATITGSRPTSPPHVEESSGADVTGPATTDDPSLVWSVIGRDNFERSVADGWGTAELGGTWQRRGATLAPGVATGFALAEAADSALSLMSLSGATAHNADVTFTIAGPGSADVIAGAVLRESSEGSGYLAGIMSSTSGVLSVTLEQFDATGAAHALAVPVAVDQLPASAASVLRVRAQVTGIDPATIKVRVWPAEQQEPATWQQSAVDWTGVLQRDGRVGIGWMLVSSSSTPAQLTFDNFQAASADLGGNR